jgi:Holliday junction resolvase RusA-like endonuclease
MAEVSFSKNGVRLKIFASPVAKGRPRLGRNGTFTPHKTKRAESILQSNVKVALIGAPHFFQKPLEGPLFVAIVLGVKRPKSRPKAIHPAVRPDLDNYGKLVCDAMNGILWKDDGQICELVLQKVYSDVEYTEILCGVLDDSLIAC